jgi:hypothetical protein
MHQLRRAKGRLNINNHYLEIAALICPRCDGVMYRKARFANELAIRVVHNQKAQKSGEPAGPQQKWWEEKRRGIAQNLTQAPFAISATSSAGHKCPSTTLRQRMIHKQTRYSS